MTEQEQIVMYSMSLNNKNSQCVQIKILEKIWGQRNLHALDETVLSWDSISIDNNILRGTCFIHLSKNSEHCAGKVWNAQNHLLLID